MKRIFKNPAKRIFGLSVPLMLLLIGRSAAGQDAGIPDYRNPSLPIERRVDDLLSRMNVEEKVAQLQCQINESDLTNGLMKRGIGGLGCILRPYDAREAAEKLNRIQKFMIEQTRLGVPVIMHDEALHGLICTKATSFPQAIGLAATWDPDLLGRVAEAIALETKSRGIRQVLSPTINIARDVRWGRTEETYGEDPFLASKMAVAFVRAFEKNGVLTTPKHYAANVGDGGRDSNPVHFSERLMREVYLPAFKASVIEGGATSIMAAYNSLDGIPCSSNRRLLTDLLRGEWGFKGFVVSDYGSVGGILSMHKTAVDSVDCARQAIEAGLDVELPFAEFYRHPLLEAVKRGLVSQEVLDRAVRRVLEAKFRLGLFENPYADPDAAEKINDSSEHRALALDAARKAVVLLKNENGTLPFRKDLRSIAVVGPLADAAKLGGYSGGGMRTVSVLEGIRNACPNAAIHFAKGPLIESMTVPVIRTEYLIPAGGKKGESGLRGEYFNNMNLSGTPALTRIDRTIHFDWGGGSPDPLIRVDRFSIRWTGGFTAPVSGLHQIVAATDDGVRVTIDGRLADEAWIDRGPTQDAIPINLVKGRFYDIKIEYYENGGDASANLGWDVERIKKDQDGSDILTAAEAVKKSDAAVVVVGVREGEGRDRADLGLTPELEKLIRTVTAEGKPTAVVLINGSAITMQNWLNDAGAVLEAWYPGEEGGNAVADVIFGKTNPGGKLPITFPISAAQCPLYYNTKSTGRGYDYVNLSGKPLFPFGYGLSYTTFEYGNLRLSATTVKPDETVRVSVDVRNTGSVRGDEVVQLYVHDLVGSVSRPLKELRGFKRIALEPKEIKTVTLELTPDHLSMYNKEMKWILEPGMFQIMVGASSEDIRLRANLEVAE
jgi:beta-glucosidase